MALDLLLLFHFFSLSCHTLLLLFISLSSFFISLSLYPSLFIFLSSTKRSEWKKSHTLLGADFCWLDIFVRFLSDQVVYIASVMFFLSHTLTHHAHTCPILTHTHPHPCKQVCTGMYTRLHSHTPIHPYIHIQIHNTHTIHQHT